MLIELAQVRLGEFFVEQFAGDEIVERFEYGLVNVAKIAITDHVAQFDLIVVELLESERLVHDHLMRVVVFFRLPAADAHIGAIALVAFEIHAEYFLLAYVAHDVKVNVLVGVDQIVQFEIVKSHTFRPRTAQVVGRRGRGRFRARRARFARLATGHAALVTARLDLQRANMACVRVHHQQTRM